VSERSGRAKRASEAGERSGRAKRASEASMRVRGEARRARASAKGGDRWLEAISLLFSLSLACVCSFRSLACALFARALLVSRLCTHAALGRGQDGVRAHPQTAHAGGFVLPQQLVGDVEHLHHALVDAHVLAPLQKEALGDLELVVPARKRVSTCASPASARFRAHSQRDLLGVGLGLEDLDVVCAGGDLERAL
jgi:hypothetical protein